MSSKTGKHVGIALKVTLFLLAIGLVLRYFEVI